MIVVSIPRQRRETFTSFSPIQVVNAKMAREASLMDKATILQTSTAACCFQVDQAFGNFVTDGGLGSSNANQSGLSEALQNCQMS